MTVTPLLPFRALADALSRLVGAGLVPRAGELLMPGMVAAEHALGETILLEIPAFRNSGNPDILPELAVHGHAHVEEVGRLFGGGAIGDFAFVKAHARRRADQRFPLDATLHAYRCGHRVLSHWLRDAVVPLAAPNADQAIAAVADFAIEYTNAISIISATEYAAQTRLLAEAEGDQRTELFNVLLSGYDESDGRVAQLLKRAGYLEQRQAYCVAAVQAVNASEMENIERAQRIVTAISMAAANTPFRVLAGVRNNLAVAVFSNRRRQSGWTAPHVNLAAQLRPVLEPLGLSVLTGISGDHPSTAFLPRALGEAMVALEFASVTARVRLFAELPPRALLIHHGGNHLRATPPAWAEALASADPALIETLRAIAAADLNVQQAARLLGKHPNTLYARLSRLRDLTGLDGMQYAELTEMLLMADCLKL